MIATRKELEALLNGQHGQPHSLLGMHPITHDGRRGVVVRAFVQDARSCDVVEWQNGAERRYPMEQLDALGRPSPHLAGPLAPCAVQQSRTCG